MHPSNGLSELIALTEARTKTRNPHLGPDGPRLAKQVALRARRKQSRELGNL